MRNLPQDTLSPCSPDKGEHGSYLKKTIDELEAEAFDNWPEFIKKATTNKDFEQNSAILSDNQAHIPFAKAFIPFTGTFCDEIGLYLREKPFKLSTTALENLVTGLLQDYIEACGLTLYCTIQDEIPDRNQASYEAWSENFYRHRWTSFTAQYSVLGVFLNQRFDQYFHHCREVFDRLEKDIPLIQKTFKTRVETISCLEFRLSDRHNHGRSVCKIEINGRLKIIYKPKSLKNEVWMQNLLSSNPGFKESGIGQYTVLDMGEYGWSECIQPDATIVHSAKDFIESYSSLLALLYLINASDMHTENAMVCNNTVYPVDLETIFNPPVDKPKHEFSWRDYNIFFTGMLFDDLDMHLARPDNKTHYYNNQNNHAMYRVVVDSNSGVSLHIQESAKKKEEDRQYRPSQLSEEEWLSFAQKTEQKILHYRDHFLSDNASENSTLSCRYVPRNTAFYARIQQVLYHPHKLKNFKDWEDYIGQLIETLDPDQEANAEGEIKLINSEMSQLKRGDIPYFTYSSASKNLHADNAVIIKDFFHKTGKASIQEKLKEFNNIDAKEVKNLLVAKYVIWNQKPIDFKSNYSQKNQKYSDALLNDRILDAVRNITETILYSANKSANQPARWLSHEGDITGLQATHTAGSFSYYNGYWGIIAFLVAAEKNLPEQASSAITDFIDREMQIWSSDKKKKSSFSNAGLSGLGGNIKALLMIDAIRYDSESVMLRTIYDEKDEIFKALNKKFDVKQFTDIDYMAGKLGLVSVLHKTPDGFVDEKILKVFLDNYHNDLLNYWNSYTSRRDKALVGFAHGISSLIDHLALCLSTEKTDAISTNKLLSKVWEYDRSCKVTVSNIWSDNRYLDIRPVNRSWCHGLPGIGMSRLSLLNIEQYKKHALEDLNLILQILGRENKTAGFHHLCCGDCGEIDFLIETSKIEPLRAKSEELLRSRLPVLLDQIGNGQSFFGTAGKTDSSMAPDFFQGAAGIGYTLLRLRDCTLPLPY